MSFVSKSVSFDQKVMTRWSAGARRPVAARETPATTSRSTAAFGPLARLVYIAVGWAALYRIFANGNRSS